MTKTYAIIGDPIDHSLSPSIHNAAFKELGMDCTYIAFRVPRGELQEGVESLRKINVSGFNVTIPHKIEMMKYLDDSSEECRAIGATNTVSNEEGRLIGHNTDMSGFMEPIKRRSIAVKNETVLLVGAGGAARAIVAGFAKEGATKITIANRTAEKSRGLVEFASKLGMSASAVTLQEAGRVASQHRFIVNATSVGLKNEPSPISTEGINSENIVYDIIYMPMNTDLISEAKKKSATIIYGYEMLLWQAAAAFEIWHKVKAPHEAMKRVLLGGF